MNFVALVGDMNGQSEDRLDIEYNFAGYPSVFYDGGDNVGVGGDPDENFYRSRIEASGQRVVPVLDLITRIDHISDAIYQVRVKIGNGVPANSPPAIPTITGPSATEPNILNGFQANSTDPDADQITYQYDIDGVISNWSGPINSGDNVYINYTWTQGGTYGIKVRAKDSWDIISDWSPLYSVQVGCCVDTRGNVEGDIDDIVDISDLVYLVDFMFTGGPAPICPEEGNVEGDAGEIIDISDLVYLVDFMFTGGPTPPACP